MQLTNRLGLPKAIEEAVRRDPYDRGSSHISVTGLIGPARKRALELQHGDQLVEDVSERLYSLMGQIAHGILERSGHDDNIIKEQRLYIERYGWIISGQFDQFVIDEGCLQDYKLTSTWAVKDGVKEEWEAQLNIYALMLREHGYTVNRAEIVALLRDWSKGKARTSQYYPPHQCKVMPVELWPDRVTESVIRARLIAHGEAQTELPFCTDEERWKTPDKWAVCKRGNSRASSLHDSENEARDAYAEQVEKKPKEVEKFYWEKRPGEYKRCADYCPAAPVCSQWKQDNPNPLKLQGGRRAA